jgi:ubiquitin C-terminal hydrolase
VLKADKERRTMSVMTAILSYLENHPNETPATVETKLRQANCFSYLVAADLPAPHKMVIRGIDGKPKPFTLWCTTYPKEVALKQKYHLIKQYSKSDDSDFNDQLNLLNLEDSGWPRIKAEDALEMEINEAGRTSGHTEFWTSFLIDKMQELPGRIRVRLETLGKYTISMNRTLQDLQIFHDELHASRDWFVKTFVMAMNFKAQNEKQLGILTDVQKRSIQAIVQLDIWLESLHQVAKEKGPLYVQGLKELSAQIKLDSQKVSTSMRAPNHQIEIYASCLSLLKKLGIFKPETASKIEEIPTPSSQAPDGLPNIGNSCYLNASLQLFAGMPQFKALLQSKKPQLKQTRLDSGAIKLEEPNTYQARCDFFEELQKTLKILQAREPDAIKAQMSALRWMLFTTHVSPEFNLDALLGQQDAAAFVGAALDTIGYEFTTRTQRVFSYQGKQHQQLQRAEVKTTVSLSLNADCTFEELLKEEHCGAQVVDANWKATVEGQQVIINKFEVNTLFESLPESMVIQLQRFDDQLQKNMDDVAFDNAQRIDLSYLLAPEKRTAAHHYHVAGFILHDGASRHAGRYRACRLEGKEWRLYDDKHVSVLTNEEANRLMQQSYVILLNKSTS